MANTSNAAYSTGGQAPLFTGQIMAQNLGDPDARMFKGTATVTGDGASATWTVNFIDGSQALPFTPSGVIVTKMAGVAATLLQSVTSITATSMLLTFSANLAASAFSVAFIAFK